MNMEGKEPLYSRPDPGPKKEPVPEGFELAIPVDHAAEIYQQEQPKNWAENSTFEMTLPFYGFEHVDLQTGHADQVGGDYSRWLEAKHSKSKNLRGPDNALPHDYTAPQAWRTAIPEELYSSSYITEKSLKYLENHVSKNPDEPFFMMMSYPDPHHPFTPPGKYWDMYEPEDMPLPESFFSNTQAPPNVAWAHQRRDDGNQVTTGMGLFAAASEREVRER